jgi:hypothetical protein
LSNRRRRWLWPRSVCSWKPPSSAKELTAWPVINRPAGQGDVLSPGELKNDPPRPVAFLASCKSRHRPFVTGRVARTSNGPSGHGVTGLALAKEIRSGPRAGSRGMAGADCDRLQDRDDRDVDAMPRAANRGSFRRIRIETFTSCRDSPADENISVLR